MSEDYKAIEEATDEDTDASKPVFEGKEKAQQKKIDWGKPQYPETWNFDMEDTIEGIIRDFGEVSIKSREAKFVNVKTVNGTFTVWCGAVIDEALQKAKPVIGDTIGIKYLGKEKGERGYVYRIFDVRVIKQTTLEDV